MPTKKAHKNINKRGNGKVRYDGGGVAETKMTDKEQ